MFKDVPKNRIPVQELFYSMRVFDVDGLLIGRLFFENSQAFTVLKPDGSTYERTLSDIQHSIEHRFWIADPNDPAVTGKWRSRTDVPPGNLGQGFQDGHRLGVEDGINLAGAFSEPPFWLYDDEPLALVGDEFNDGYRTGISTTMQRILSERFKGQKPIENPKSWENTRWGVDPLDPNAVASFQKGFEYSKHEKEWLPELNAARRISELWAQEMESDNHLALNRMAFGFGFKSGMENRFPNRY